MNENELAALSFQDRISIPGQEHPVTLTVSLSVTAGHELHPTWGSQLLGRVAQRIQKLTEEELKLLAQRVEAQDK